MAFDKINDIDEEYSNKFIEQFEELPIEEVKNSNRLFVEKIKSMEKKVSILLYYIIKENNRPKKIRHTNHRLCMKESMTWLITEVL